MPVPTVITGLSTTAASNYPAGTDSPSTLDDVQRAHASFIRQLYNGDTTVYTPAGTGAVATTVQAKLRESVSVKDFGAVGDGVTDDTVAIQAALTASRYVTVPAGMTCLISSTITVPSQTRLSFLGGDGNLVGAFPPSYFIKKSTMTTVGISISQRGVVDGGGLLGEVGNTGDGVQLANNAAVLRNFIVAKAGRDGVRVGTDGVFANCNSTVVEYVKSRGNGRHGFYVHDGVSVGTADANAGTMLQCTANDNGADGIRLGHAFWVSIINCLTEINDGWGLYLSGIDNNSYPECRWTTVLGGDFNEGNVTGQVYDGSYFATFVQPDAGSVPTTARTGLQGGGYRSVVSSFGASTLQGLTIETDAAGPATRPLIVLGGSSGGNTYPVSIRQRTTASNGDGPGLVFEVDPSTGTYRTAAQIAVSQRTTNVDKLVFYTNNAGSMTAMLVLNPFEVSVTPGADNTTKLGEAALRWSVVYAATGTINTSDAREKQQIRSLSDAENAVAVRLKSLIKAFKFNDAVQAKGDAARIHVGVIAQEVIAAFKAEGLDASRYAIVCYDEWEAEPEVMDKDGNVTIPARVAGNRYGVRYEELLAFIISAL